jgi:hypothetical protein
LPEYFREKSAQRKINLEKVVHSGPKKYCSVLLLKKKDYMRAYKGRRIAKKVFYTILQSTKVKKTLPQN